MWQLSKKRYLTVFKKVTNVKKNATVVKKGLKISDSCLNKWQLKRQNVSNCKKKISVVKRSYNCQKKVTDVTIIQQVTDVELESDI